MEVDSNARLISLFRSFGRSMVFDNGNGKPRPDTESDNGKMIGEDMNSRGLSQSGLIYHDGEYAYYTEPNGNFKLLIYETWSVVCKG